MNPKIFVFRTNYDDAHSFVMDELNHKGVLRQGWGRRGSSLISDSGNRLTESEWIENCKMAGINGYNADELRKRHRILKKMLEINKGDLLVVPKTRNNQVLSICTVRGEYKFDIEVENKWEDFHHCIDVESVRSYSYDSCAEAVSVSRMFIAYQSPVNRVKDERYKQKVLSLYKHEDQYNSLTTRQVIIDIRRKSLELISHNIMDVPPVQFEDFLVECLKIKGYQVIRKNEYDGDGADTDIVATYSLPFFEDIIDPPITIFMQVKKKHDIDRNDQVGINQLIMARENARRKGQNPICVLVNTSTDISNTTRQYAKEEGIAIIHGSNILDFILTTNFA